MDITAVEGKIKGFSEKCGLNGFVLKMIAIITMFIDHMGYVVCGDNITMRIIGRLAFPIFCFFIAEGAMKTSDIKKYELRLFLFALVSEIPADLAFHNQLFYWGYQNVFFTLLLGLLAIHCLQVFKDYKGFLFVILFMGVAIFMNTDYSASGVLYIVLFYVWYERILRKQLGFAFLNIAMYWETIQMYASLSSILLLFYNGKRGPKMKWFFYAFYPAHLLGLFLYMKIMGRY